MAKRFPVVVFDWDGTLVDSAAVIVHALQSACRDLGVQVPTDERARHIIGLGLHDALAHAVPSLAPSDYPGLVERYRHHFLAHDEHVGLFAGAFAGLQVLHGRGHRLGVATGKSRRGLDRSLARTGSAHFFSATRCGEEDAAKPAPDMLLTLMRVLAVPPDEMLMVGDTTHDLAMARAAGVAALAVAYGAHPEAELCAAGPLAIVHTPEALWAWLEQNG